MFDWNDQDQVGDIIWGELSESEDHIVPYPKGTEDSTLLNFGDYNKKQKNEEASTVLRSTEHTAGTKHDFAGCNLENHSTFKTNEELSAPRLDMDSWPDLPSLSAALGKGYNDENGPDSIATELMNDFNETSDLNKVRVSTGGAVQLDGESEMFGNDHEDKESDSFLDCDWANIGDFDDLDRIFSNNDSIFGHEMVGNAGEYLCPSSDVISGTAQSIPIPDMPLSREETSDHGCSSFHFDELPCGNRKSEEKTADDTVKTEQAECKTHVTSECCGTHNLQPDKDDGQKKLLKSRKKAEERNKNKTKQNLNGAWSHNVSQSHQSPSPNMHTLVKTPLQTFQSPTATQQRQVGGAKNMEHLGPSNQFLLSGYGYSPYHFPVFPLMPHTHAERNQVKPVAVSCKVFPDSSKHSNSLAKPSDIPSRPSTMTPQEKIEKLRRRQQMQAMLAIQQQQQQFGHQITGNDSLVLQIGSPKKQSQESVTSSAAVDDSGNKISASDMSMLLDQDESQRISTLIDDHSLDETIYYELQDALGKLDITVRLCIRDSLFRLAQSAMERQSAGDRSSTNKSNKDEDEVSANQETNRQNRCKKLPDAETDTNPIDRTVAHLLFYKHSESCTGPVKDEIPQSPVSRTPASKMPLHAHGSTSEENPENIGEMEVQP
ncbi:protein LNK2 isoform X1 [Elaeis guineensis]|uniref:Protein LNK2 isoform X1 n=1 Tax=Elaeis guineensis var. tenera TaxID=51953 RepID=A0A6I9RUA9_ELAGV|nr:protein LNK2 isoform X1 [Elaeis guineensis]XP_010931992.1 protein LNK2 isoform X1 [Elaeis guineensis]